MLKCGVFHAEIVNNLVSRQSEMKTNGIVIEIEKF